MVEEFQEFEVFWPEQSQSQSHRRQDRLYHRTVFQDENINPAGMDINNSNSAAAAQQKKSSKQRNTSYSLPVTIPCKLNNSSLHYSDSNESDGEELGKAEMVPPHLMVAWRCTGQMAYSVCTGNGRTLKGHDLSRVRNSILRMAGLQDLIQEPKKIKFSISVFPQKLPSEEEMGQETGRARYTKPEVSGIS